MLQKRQIFIITPAWSFEGIVVNIADEIAQIHHDIEDSLFMNIISIEEAKNYVDEILKPLILENYSQNSRTSYLLTLDNAKKSKSLKEFMGYASKLIIDFLVSNLIRETMISFENLATEFQISSRNKFLECYQEIGIEKIIKISCDIENCWQTPFSKDIVIFDHQGTIRGFQKKFKNRVINSEEVQKLNNLGFKVVSELFEAFYLNPKILPDLTLLYFVEESEDARKTMNETRIYSIRSNASAFQNKQKEVWEKFGIEWVNGLTLLMQRKQAIKMQLHL